MNREELLLDIANKFIQDNPNKIAIAGSLMLKIRGVDLGREIHDLDLITNHHPLTIVIPKEIEYYKKEEQPPTIYLDGSLKCQYNDITIDILQSDETIDMVNGIPLGSLEKLIEAKIKYAQQNNIQAEKHKQDLIILNKLK